MDAEVFREPLVSIVIPLYNKSETIQRAMESIFLQKYDNIEIIVVDDGSTDKGVDILNEEFKDPRIKLHRQKNAGPGAARNAGLRLSEGEFITFLDADDEWSAGFLSRAISLLVEHEECVAFTSAFYRSPGCVNRWSEMAGRGFSEGPWELSASTNREELSNCLSAFHACTAVYRTSIVKQLGGFYDEDRCTYGEDVYLWVRIIFKYKIYHHITPLGYYHTEDSGLGVTARGREVPLEPIFTNFDPVRKDCREDLKSIFDLWLARHAIDAIFVQLDSKSVDTARWLLKRFPRIKSWRREYFKIRLRLDAPLLWRMMRNIRGL